MDVLLRLVLCGLIPAAAFIVVQIAVEVYVRLGGKIDPPTWE